MCGEAERDFILKLDFDERALGWNRPLLPFETKTTLKRQILIFLNLLIFLFPALRNLFYTFLQRD